jgi:hypothetical protein
LGALVPGILTSGAATHILYVVRSREAGSLRDLAMWMWPQATGRPRDGRDGERDDATAVVLLHQ